MFVKLFSQILDSSISVDRKLRHFFTDLLLLADSDGVVMLTEEAIAHRIRAPIEEVHWGVTELAKPDPNSKNPDHEGRRIERIEGLGYGWRIINYQSYRKTRSPEDLRAGTRERVRRFRERQKALRNASNASNSKQRQRQSKRQNPETTCPSGEGPTVAEVLEEKRNPIDEVFAAYQALAPLRGFDPKKAKLTPKRRRLIQQRFDEGFDVIDLSRSLQGFRSSAWHCGENDRQTVFLDLELLLRDAKHVEEGFRYGKLVTTPPERIAQVADAPTHDAAPQFDAEGRALA